MNQINLFVPRMKVKTTFFSIVLCFGIWVFLVFFIVCVRFFMLCQHPDSALQGRNLPLLNYRVQVSFGCLFS